MQAFGHGLLNKIGEIEQICVTHPLQRGGQLRIYRLLAADCLTKSGKPAESA